MTKGYLIKPPLRIAFLAVLIPVAFVGIFIGTYSFLMHKNVIIEIPWVSENLSFLIPKFVADDLAKRQDYRSGRSVLVNKGKAPEFVGISQWFNSDPVNLKDLKGKVVVLSFDRVYCQPCLSLYTYLRDWQLEYGSDIAVISIHSPVYEKEKDPAEIERVIEERGVNFPIGLDISNTTTHEAYKISEIPKVYVIDQLGYIRYEYRGLTQFSQTEEAIKELLENPTN